MVFVNIPSFSTTLKSFMRMVEAHIDRRSCDLILSDSEQIEGYSVDLRAFIIEFIWTIDSLEP